VFAGFDRRPAAGERGAACALGQVSGGSGDAYGPAALAEIKKVIRSVPAGDARRTVGRVLGAATADEVTALLTEGIGQWLDLSMFTGRWSLSPAE
jgi:hypothetical protein